MNLKEAKEIIERLKHLEKPMQDPLLQTELKLALYQYKEAKGYLSGVAATLELEEVKGLARIIERSISIAETPPSLKMATEALAAFTKLKESIS